MGWAMLLGGEEVWVVFWRLGRGMNSVGGVEIKHFLHNMTDKRTIANMKQRIVTNMALFLSVSINRSCRLEEHHYGRGFLSRFK